MIMDKLKALISEQFGVPEESLTDDTSMVDDLGADSLDFVELMMALEEEFDLEISDTEDVVLSTVLKLQPGDPAEIRAKMDGFRSENGARIIELEIDPVDVSSTQVRNGLKAHRDVSGLIPEKEYDYIIKKGLYND